MMSSLMNGDRGSVRSHRGSALRGDRSSFALNRRDGHVADETHAATRYGADQLLLVPIVADRATRGIDPTRQGRVGHVAASPDRSNKIIFADNAVAIFHEILEQVEYLRLDCNRSGPAVQLPSVCIKLMVAKEKLHFDAPRAHR